MRAAKQIRYSKILVPAKVSSLSTDAAMHAIHIAKLDGAEIIFLTVLEAIENKTSGRGPTKQPEIREYLQSLESAAREEGIAARSVILESMGHSEGRAIVSYAALNGIDFIVLGASAHGIRRFSELTYVPIANRILVEAECPVLIIS